MVMRDKIATWTKTNGRCWYCGIQTVMKGSFSEGEHTSYGDAFVVDHQHPRSKGGTDDPSNLVPACMTCNCAKGGRTLEEYRQYYSWKQSGIPKFTDEQIEFLEQMGVEIPEPEILTFFGEQHEG